jgi:curli production assembly/transport component CsgG
MLEYHQPFSDNIDGRVAGRFNDYYLRGTLGVVFNFGRFLPPGPKSVEPVSKNP